MILYHNSYSKNKMIFQIKNNSNKISNKNFNRLYKNICNNKHNNNKILFPMNSMKNKWKIFKLHQAKIINQLNHKIENNKYL